MVRCCTGLCSNAQPGRCHQHSATHKLSSVQPSTVQRNGETDCNYFSLVPLIGACAAGFSSNAQPGRCHQHSATHKLSSVQPSTVQRNRKNDCKYNHLRTNAKGPQSHDEYTTTLTDENELGF